ncbi:MAG: penicillin-binding protein 1A [Gemmatimonadaceae bacterium]
MPILKGRSIVALCAFAVASNHVVAQPPAEPWRIIQPAQVSLVLARDGSLIGEIGREKRFSISIRTLPKYVGQAFVAVEDQRFYQHDGVDVVGIAGALKDAVTGDLRGASTITQQLVGNMHPTIIDRRDPGLGRKIREQQAAREMEKHYSKEQILEAYINQIPFGRGWLGIEMASRHYLGKPASGLTLAEAAMLAAMPKGPAIYDPIKYPDRVRARRDLVLSVMAQQRYITSAQAAAAKREPIVTVPNAGFVARARYFVDVVNARASQMGVEAGSGGFRIHTTLDPSLQLSASEALRDGAKRVEERAGYRHPTLARHQKGNPNYLQGMIVALDPRVGDVLALIGGRDYGESQYNRAVKATRQPGSTFKPIVYAAAIRSFIPPNEIIPDTPLAIPLKNGTIYQPQNSDGEFLGPVTLREALARSRNTVAVQLGQRIGMDTIINLARRMGIETPIAPYPASAIGASAVHPLDFVTAFAPFANQGMAVEPRLITKIEDRSGKTVRVAPRAAPSAVLDPQVAFIVRDMMRDAVDRGTGTAVRRFVPDRIPVAGKTGTPNDNTDVWFVGMTPDILAGVWLGFDAPRTITPGAAGGSLAAPIWGDMISRFYRGREVGEWTVPEGLVVAELDRVTGELASELTPVQQRYTEYFIPGTEPTAMRPNPWGIFSAGPILP